MPSGSNAEQRRVERIFYAASGPGDLIESNRRWKLGEHNPTEVSITFSGQIQDFCRDIGAPAYFVSTHPRKEKISDGMFTIEHRPKAPSTGLRWYIAELAYGVGLLRTALRFRASIALMDSGAAPFFFMVLFPLFGIKVLPILHNTLWPNGFPPETLAGRVTLALDTFFWRFTPVAAIAVSPECERQVEQLCKRRNYRIHQTRAQFLPGYFEAIAPPPARGAGPFRVMFIGRVVKAKGVFDILDIAKQIEDDHPGLVRWELCGTGADLDELERHHETLGLADTVVLHGWTSLEDLARVYERSHAAIVPTRSAFQEGLAMTAAEAILAGRPIITNPVVPALEILRSAAMEAKTNDSASHRRCVECLATDAALYERLREACSGLSSQFYDRQLGLAAVLRRALATA